MNLHFLQDSSFTEGAIKQFEEYYPEKNIYIIDCIKSKAKFNYNINGKNVIFLKLSNKSNIRKIFQLIERNDISNIFLHLLTRLKSGISHLIKSKYDVKIYWIFFGADLYSRLKKDFNYELFDYDVKKFDSNRVKSKLTTVGLDLWFWLHFRKNLNSIHLKMIKEVDFFCFWNYYDFLLLKKYYASKALYKDFLYINSLSIPENNSHIDKEYVLVNNSASIYGNHLTILNRLTEIINCDSSQIILPLSYGNNRLKQYIIKYINLKKDSKLNLNVVLEYMNLNEYSIFLNKVKVAFFGSRRQEGAGNIFILLALGAKVFLREDNNLLSFFRNKGFIVYSFEKDFNSSEDLAELDAKLKIKNKIAFESYISTERINDIMVKLISD